jgi:hypothetical protein
MNVNCQCYGKPLEEHFIIGQYRHSTMETASVMDQLWKVTLFQASTATGECRLWMLTALQGMTDGLLQLQDANGRAMNVKN